MRLERSTWPQVEAYFAQNDTVMLLFGSIEQHGRHNPLGTDLFAPVKLAELVEDKLPGLLIAPALPFGATPRFTEFPGTVSLGDELLYHVVLHMCESLYTYGARHFIFLNGHGGNTKALTDAGLTMSRRGCRCALLDWWSMVRDIKPEWAGGHGGGQETSAMLYIDPTLVDTAAIDDMHLVHDAQPEPQAKSQSGTQSEPSTCDDGVFETVGFDRVSFRGVTLQMPRPTRDYAENGWIGPDHPKDATAQWGEEMLGAVADWMVEFIPAFEKTPLPERDGDGCAWKTGVPAR